MTATNININEFINILTSIKNSGSKLIDLDMIPDENHPSMNKLIIHAVGAESKSKSDKEDQMEENRIVIRNPDIRTDNNDIFNSFKDLL